MQVAPTSAMHPQVEDLGDRLVVTFRPREAHPDLPFLDLGAWEVAVILIGWTFGLFVAIWQIARGGAGVWFVAVWLVGWLFAGCFFMLVGVCLLWGREVLTVTSSELRIVRAVGRLARTRRYDAALVERITADKRGGVGYCLRISYCGDDVDVGGGMPKHHAEGIAAAVFARIRPRSWWDESADLGEPVVSDAAAAIEGGRSSQKVTHAGRNAVFPVVVIAALVWLAYETLRPAHPTARPGHVVQASSRMPERQNFSSPRGYAEAMTSWALSSGSSMVVTRPRCDAHATWTHWSCRALASTDLPAKAAGLAVPYRCESASVGGVTCGLAMPLPPFANKS
jgi:hypothetical protein